MRILLVLWISLFRSYQHVLQLLPACAILCTIELRHNVLSKLLDTANKELVSKYINLSFVFHTVLCIKSLSHILDSV